MRQESVTRAETILEDARERLKVGKVSSLDVARAETGLLLRRTQVQAAEQKALEASNAVRTLLSESSIELAADLVPTEKASYSEHALNLEVSLSRSLENSPDYLVAAKQLEQEQTRVAVATNAKKPQLDLVASYGLNGWGDTINETQDSLERTEYETWSVGVEFSMGLGGNRRARSELHGLKLRLQRQKLVLRDMETQLANLLATTVGKLGNLAAQLQSLEDVASFNERLLSVAIERLKQGKGDMRDVLQFEEDLVAAKDRQLEALTDYQKALLELEAFEGTLLENRDISITGLDE